MKEMELNQDHSSASVPTEPSPSFSPRSAQKGERSSQRSASEGRLGAAMAEISGKPIGLLRKGPRTESEMRAAVCRALQAVPELKALTIQVEVHDGVIILRGRVPHARLRALAEDCLDELEYLQVIRNEIEVRLGEREGPRGENPRIESRRSAFKPEATGPERKAEKPDLCFRMHGDRLA